MTYRSLLIVCLATLGLAAAGWGQADGKIAFTSWREGAEDVWIMNADGSNPVNLTQGRHGRCVSPAWSPDGTKIAYLAFSKDPASVRVDYSIGAVWVMDADGGNSQQMGSLTNPRSDDLVWAEDGSLIYFIKYLTGRYEVFVVALDGSGSSLMDWREAAWIVKGSLGVGSDQSSVSMRTKRPWALSCRLKATVRLDLRATIKCFFRSWRINNRLSLAENQLSANT